MAALPVGSNALIFSQRYGTLQAETSAAIVFSTLGVRRDRAALAARCCSFVG